MARVHVRKNMLLVVLAVLALVVTPFGSIKAARPDSLKDLLSDSRPSLPSNHTITLDQAAGGDFSAGDTLVLTFATAFDTSGFASTDALDYDITVNGVEETIVDSTDGCTGDTIAITTVAADVFTFTACSGYIGEAAGTVIVIEIGTHASVPSAGNTQIVNSTAATYNLAVDTTDEDSQDTVLVILAGVTVTATVDETLTVTAAAVTAANCDVTAGTDIDAPPVTATAIPFGTISTDAFYNACQSLTIGTNAAGGYQTTLTSIAGLDSGANPFGVGVCDATCSITVAAAWATAGNNGYGYCMKDETGDAAATADATDWAAANQCGGGTPKFKLVPDLSGPQTAEPIMQSGGGIGSDVSEIGVRISADAAQAAGTYTGIFEYTTTGTF